ncbi:hypothetical protein TBLA_0B05000 [Henningerozyma blattae CBS 6284]|uniref:DNA-directed RNA polymerase III subunit RPC3 n=1 Tax=Henningerozyma blattae (strain ATCC 34711 / CBS 6284 / DSM 70876 / NBRC 10599 / NRRL Y-10934 / UCD 77-7) TaxID=1071380 RepID=I2GYY3_HENB6|nr:hypothetical protein TBLA_0B05000 [Tetrapisispora blattae CBS 6284]CCH59335.1 hypothetical protein TBLA_0B05000 [Tetrapisispora blattae CBS 6284]
MSSITESSQVNSLPNKTNDEEEDLFAVSSLEQRTVSPELFLYSELVNTHIGERAKLVIELLIDKGRLTVREIYDRLNQFRPKVIKSILVSLIQLRCVRYHTERDFKGKSNTYYYFNEEGPLLWLYSGLILEEIDLQFNSTIATQIVQNILSLGSLTPNDLQSITTNQKNITKSKLSTVLVKLVESGFLVRVSDLHYIPMNDFWNTLYQKEYASIPRNSPLSDLRKKAEAKNKAKVQFLTKLKEVYEFKDLITIDPRTSMRKIKDSIPLTFNLERFLKSRRSKQLVQLAKSRCGSYPSLIYNVALKITEQSSILTVDPLTKTGLLQELTEAEAMLADREQDESKSGMFNAMDIAKYLPKSIDLRNSLAFSIPSKNKRKRDNSEPKSVKKIKLKMGLPSLKFPRVTIQMNEHAHEDNGEMDGNEDQDLDDDIDLDMDDNDDDDDPHSISMVNSLLKMLANSEVPFLQESKPGVYYIPYTKLLPKLKSFVYDYLIASTLGPSAVRIRRCVIDNHLVTEKVINSKALMKESDIRSTVGELIKYNALEVQEVPRTNDRAAARSVFLFRFKEKHSYDFMKQNIAWNIANLLYKNYSLKQENSTLLTKANREDVKGREAELLLPSELNQLKMVNERELNVYARITRLLSLWEVYKFL